LLLSKSASRERRRTKRGRLPKREEPREVKPRQPLRRRKPSLPLSKKNLSSRKLSGLNS